MIKLDRVRTEQAIKEGFRGVDRVDKNLALLKGMRDNGGEADFQ